MTVAARRAITDDIDDLIWLDEALRSTLIELRGGQIYLLRDSRPQPVGPSYLQAINDPSQLVLIGTINGHPVGFTAVEIRHLEPDYKLADVTEIFVIPQARDVGVGAAMMQSTLEWADINECDGIDSRAMPGDRGTKNFFESNAMVARAILVHRDLRGPEPPERPDRG